MLINPTPSLISSNSISPSLSLSSLFLFNTHSSSIPKILISSSLHKSNRMGNCIRCESPMQWGGDDWEDRLFSEPQGGGEAAVAADREEMEGLLEKSRQHGSSNAATLSAAAAVVRKEVTIRITKRQLEELLGKPDAKEGKPVELLVSQLMAMSASDRFETGQRSWRPALKSIPEVN